MKLFLTVVAMLFVIGQSCTSAIAEEPRVLKGHSDGLRGLAFSPDGDFLYAASSGESKFIQGAETTQLNETGRGDLKRWNVKTGRPVKSTSFNVKPLKFVQPKRVTDPPPGKPLTSPCALAITNNGKTLILPSWDGNIRLWNVDGWKKSPVVFQWLHDLESVMGVWPLRISVLLAPSPDGKLVAASTLPQNLIGVWDLETGKIVRKIQINSPYSAAFSPDSKKLAFTANQASGIFDFESGKGVWLSGAPQANRPVISLRCIFTIDGKQVITFQESPPHFHVWDSESGRHQSSYGTTSPKDENGHTLAFNSNYASCFSPDGSRLAAMHVDRIVLWNVATGDFSSTVLPFRAKALAFSPDGMTLASGSGEEGIIKLWSLSFLASAGTNEPKR